MEEVDSKNEMVNERIAEYEYCLLRLYGAIICGKALRHILGYRTGEAFRMAVHKKRLPVPTFIPEGRRMRCARTHDIAKWLTSIDADIDQILYEDFL